MKTKTTFSKAAIFVIAIILNFNAVAQPAHFLPKGIGGGGAQFAPSINPANPNEMYVSCDMSPLFHTTDGGASWDVVDYHSIFANHATHVEFTNNPLIRYCMNCDPNNGYYTPIKTTDGGTIWTPLASDPSSGNAYYTIANPQNSNQVIVTSYTDFYLSNNGGTTFGASFYHSSSAYIAGTFWDGLNIYICTDKGIINSTNGGATWNNNPSMPGIPIDSQQIVSCAAAKANGITRFYCITMTIGNVYPGVVGSDCGYFAKVYTMDFGTSNWIPKMNGITANTDHPFCVGMAVNNIDVAYIAGENSGTSYPIVLKTVDSGANWVHNFNTTTNQNIKTGYCGSGGDFQWTWPQYIYGISVAANDPNKVIFTDMGFTHKTTDGGANWQAAYVPASDVHPANASTPTRQYYHGNGIEPTACWDIMWTDANHIFAGYTDVHALRSNDAGTTWGFDYTGLNNYNTTYKFVKNPSNGAIYAATSSVHDMYESTRLADAQLDAGSGAIMMSTDNGATFTTMHNFARPVIWLALDPTNVNRMYASVINHQGSGSAGGIWVSNDIQNGASSVWTHCTNPARTQGHPFNIRVLTDGTVVTTYCGRRTPNPSSHFSDSSGVFVSTDGGTTWSDKSANPGMHYWTMDLIVDPYDATQNTWYVCVFSGWGNASAGQGGLYRTTNRGTAWTKLTGSTYDRVYSLTFDPVHSGVAYMTTETEGLWYTANINAATPSFSQVSGYPFRQPNRVYFNPYNQNQIWINSFGNGIRMGDLTTDINELNTANDAINIYPNPTTGIITLNFYNKENTSLKIKLSNIKGQLIYSKESKEAAGIYTHTFSIDTYSKGIYFLTIITDQETVVRKVVLE